MKVRNLLFSVIFLGNLVVVNIIVLVEEMIGIVIVQIMGFLEIGIENDIESMLQLVIVFENMVLIEELIIGIIE